MKKSGILLSCLLIASQVFSATITTDSRELSDERSMVLSTESFPRNLNRGWILEELRGDRVDIPKRNIKTPQVRIYGDNMMFYGNDGCNIVSGRLCALDESTIGFTPEVGTRLKKCAPDCTVGERESCAKPRSGDLVCEKDEPCANTCEEAVVHVDLAGALKEVKNYQIRGSKLYMYGTDGKEVLVFRMK